MILTSQAVPGDTGEPSGAWLEELAVPYYAFLDAGGVVDIASIRGGDIPIDPRSVRAAGENHPSVDRFLRSSSAMTRLEYSTSLEGMSAERFAAIFLPGGHGAMWDLPQNAALAALLSRAWATGKSLAAVGHGAAGLIGARDQSGSPLVAGRRLTAFTYGETLAAGLAGKLPFLLETRLRELGARFESAPDITPHAVRDGRLITGQNTASTAEVARLTLEALAVAPVAVAAE